MYLIVIAWIYVVLMMAVAEATNTTGTVLGAVVTFFLYGVGPAGLLVYLMGTPARNKALKKRAADERAEHVAALAAGSGTEKIDPQALAESATPASVPPDARGHSAGGEVPITADAGIASVRKE